MLRRLALALAAGALALPLAACDFTATGNVECHTDDAGKYVCTGSSTATPVPTTTTPPPTTETPPPTTEEPPPVEAPPGVISQATANVGLVEWDTARDDITGWHIERDGTDLNGTGVWGTDLPADAREFQFNELVPGNTYTFTLIAQTAAGPLAPLTTTRTVPEAPAEPEPTETTEPPAGDPGAVTAAEKFGWGAPIAAASDEFNYTGGPDTAKWDTIDGCWAGHNGNGQRCGKNSVVDGTKLVQTGEANGDSAWLGSKFGQQYGRWEARVRTEALGPDNGRQYHPLLIVWPDSDRWPDDGEYDFFENSAPEAQSVTAFLHYPGHTPKVQEHAEKDGVDTREWHNIAFEWTPDHLKGFIDGEEWFSFGEYDITAMPSGHLTIQFDNFYGGDMQPAKYEIDWVRTYGL